MQPFCTYEKHFSLICRHINGLVGFNTKVYWFKGKNVIDESATFVLLKAVYTGSTSRLDYCSQKKVELELVGDNSVAIIPQGSKPDPDGTTESGCNDEILDLYKLQLFIDNKVVCVSCFSHEIIFISDSNERKE